MANPVDDVEEIELEGEQPELIEVDEPIVEAEDPGEVEVIPDAKYDKKNWKEDPNGVVEDPNDKDYGQKVQRRIGKLKAASTELARQRDIASQEREEAVKAALFYKKQAEDYAKKNASVSVSELEARASSHDRAADLALKDYEDALAAGDAKRAAEANGRLADAKVNSSRLKNDADRGKAEQTQAEATATQQRQQQAATPVRVATPELRQKWFAKNAWFSLDDGNAPSNDLTSHAMKLHYSLVEKGYSPDTPDYFSAIDRNMKAKFPQRFGVATPNDATPPPSGRTITQQTNTVVGKKVTLTRSQLNTAERLGINIKDTAQLKRYAMEIAATEGSK